MVSLTVLMWGGSFCWWPDSKHPTHHSLGMQNLLYFGGSMTGNTVLDSYITAELILAAKMIPDDIVRIFSIHIFSHLIDK